MRIYPALLLITAIILVSGCLCCTGGSDDKEPVGGNEARCQVPYMEFADACCLDANANRICDTDEATTTLKAATTTLAAVTTTQQPVPETTITIMESTTTLAPTTTLKAIRGCVEKAGYDPDQVIFVYANTCGRKYLGDVSNYESRKGVKITRLDISPPQKPGETEVLECFYGKAHKGNTHIIYSCPKFLCPITGDMYEYRAGMFSSKLAGFVKKCV